MGPSKPPSPKDGAEGCGRAAGGVWACGADCGGFGCEPGCTDPAGRGWGGGGWRGGGWYGPGGGGGGCGGERRQAGCGAAWPGSGRCGAGRGESACRFCGGSTCGGTAAPCGPCGPCAPCGLLLCGGGAAAVVVMRLWGRAPRGLWLSCEPKSAASAAASAAAAATARSRCWLPAPPPAAAPPAPPAPRAPPKKGCMPLAGCAPSAWAPVGGTRSMTTGGARAIPACACEGAPPPLGTAAPTGAAGAAAAAPPPTTHVFAGVSSSTPRRTATLWSTSLRPHGGSLCRLGSRRYSMPKSCCRPSLRQSFSIRWPLS